MTFRSVFKDITVELSNKRAILEVEEDDSIAIIKKSNLKIKQILPTRFGKEVVFYREDDAKEAAQLLKITKIDGKSIFLEK